MLKIIAVPFLFSLLISLPTRKIFAFQSRILATTQTLRRSPSTFSNLLSKFRSSQAFVSMNEMKTQVLNNDNLLHCQQNSYLREGVSKVLRCDKKSGSESYLVVLDNSVLYPEGGGQPYDLGTVNGNPVVQVLKPDREFTAEDLGLGDLNTVNQQTLVVVETTVPHIVGESVQCVVDWQRRYDFMQQHTAQHLFSAVADKLYHADTVGWSLGSDFVTVDLKSNPILTNEQLLTVEEETNLMIRQNHYIRSTVYSKEELDIKLKHENKASDVEFAHFRGEVKGAALAMSELRLVSIDGIDLNPCGGTHLSSLSEINIFKIVGTEKDLANNIIKVRFVAGGRAISYFHQSIQRESAISQLISSKPNDFVSTIDKMLKDKKDLTKKYDVYNDELAYYYGKNLLARALSEFENQGEHKKPIIIVEHRYGADLKFLIRAGNTIFEENKNAACKIILVLSGDENTPVPLSTGISGSKGGKKGGDGKKAPAETKVQSSSQPTWFVQGRPLTEGPFIIYEADQINSVKDKVLELLGGRGGGRPGRLQAYASNLSNLVHLQTALQQSFP